MFEGWLANFAVQHAAVRCCQRRCCAGVCVECGIRVSECANEHYVAWPVWPLPACKNTHTHRQTYQATATLMCPPVHLSASATKETTVTFQMGIRKWALQYCTHICCCEIPVKSIRDSNSPARTKRWVFWVYIQICVTHIAFSVT